MNAHINMVMTVMQMERSARMKEKREYLYRNVRARPNLQAILDSIHSELPDCDNRLDELSKSYNKYL